MRTGSPEGKAAGKRSALGRLLGSEARGRVLTALLLGTPEHHYLRRLAARVGLQPTAVGRELKTLESLGLVDRRTDGRRPFWEVNDDAPAVPELRRLVLKVGGIREALRSALGRRADGIRWAFLHGPAVSGRVMEGALGGLYVVGDIGEREVGELIRPVTELLGREIGVRVITPAEFQAKRRTGDYSVAAVLGEPKADLAGDLRQASRKRRPGDPPPSALERAAEFGIDIDSLRENLKRSPEDRARRLAANLRDLAAIRAARRAG
jgi:DNA-binding transcriptional ArsR family regulator